MGCLEDEESILEAAASSLRSILKCNVIIDDNSAKDSTTLVMASSFGVELKCGDTENIDEGVGFLDDDLVKK